MKSDIIALKAFVADYWQRILQVSLTPTDKIPPSRGESEKKYNN